MVNCVVCGRSRTIKAKELKFSLHRFPVDSKVKKAWIEFVGKPEWEPSTNSFICSQHFQEDCFDRTSLSKIQLKKGSIPSIKIERLKYDRTLTFTTITVRPHTPPPSTSAEPDSPRKVVLKRKMTELRTKNLNYAKRIRILQKRCWYQHKRIFKLSSALKELHKTNLINEDHVAVFMNNFGKNQELINSMFCRPTHSKVTKKYGEEIRKFAVTLHFFSPKAYQYVRQKFHNCLPHVKTLSKWYATIDAGPGFTKDVLHVLTVKATSQQQKLVCSLVMDEMAIRQHAEWDGFRLHGYVDFGTTIDCQHLDLAKEVLVFMLVAINDTWKVPVGYFFTNGLSSSQKASLVSRCIDVVTSCEVDIVNLTFDGLPANFTMANILGCKLAVDGLVTYFVHNSKKIYILPDPSHMLKLVRNTFGERQVLFHEGKAIDFNYVKQLNQLQEDEGLHLANKLRRSHINFFKQKMKMKLAIQLLSNSVAEALLYCKNVLKIKVFENCESTVKFIQLMNYAFDILNSHKIGAFGFKQALNRHNISNIIEFSNELTRFILGLKLITGELLINSNRKIGFLGLLICFKSIIGMFQDYVEGENNILKYIPLYKCSQDHLELFFGSIRACGGSNNNPTTRQFTAAYKKLIVHAEVRDGGLGNCIPLQQISILNNISTCKTSPEDEINENVQLGVYEPSSSNVEQILCEHDYFFTTHALSTYVEHVVIYISGFVVRSIARKIQCEQCISVLHGDKSHLLHSFINYKDKGGLIYPSNDVIQLCMITEKLFRRTVINKVNCVQIVNEVLTEACNKDIFVRLKGHMYDTNPIQNHLLLLIKSIVNCYLNLRMHYAAKNVSQSEKIRNFYTKLILFKGQ